MSTAVKKKSDERVEFASDVPFVRTILDTDEKALDFTSRFGSKLPGKDAVANKGDAILEGYANTWVMDRDFEYISKQAFDGTLSKYLEKNPIILLQHNHDWPLGQMLDAGTDLTGLAAKGYVRQPQDKDPDWKHGAYNDVLAGILRTLSIGGFFYREVVDGDILVTEIDLFEISVVAVPSNPDSIFEAAQKAAHGMEARGNVQGRAKMLDLMAQLLGLKDATAPEIVGRPELAKRGLYHELAASATRELGVPVPEFHEWRNVAVQLDREGASVKMGTDEAKGFLDQYGDLFGLRTAKSGISMNEARALGGLEGISEKAGRALSKANEKKLTEALERLQAVLESVKQEAEEGTEEEALAAANELKSAFTNVLTEYAISDALYDGMWALRSAISDIIFGANEDDKEIDITALESSVDEFKAWLTRIVRQAVADPGALAGIESDLKVLGAMLGAKEKISEKAPLTVTLEEQPMTTISLEAI